MAALLLDHNVSRKYVGLLTGHGHHVRSARDEHLDRTDDGGVLLAAAQQGWVLVTHNRDDFWLLHRAWHRWAAAWQVTPAPFHAGVVIIPQRQHLGPDQLVSRIAGLLDQQLDLANRLYEWTVARAWMLDDVR